MIIDKIINIYDLIYFYKKKVAFIKHKEKELELLMLDTKKTILKKKLKETKKNYKIAKISVRFNKKELQDNVGELNLVHITNGFDLISWLDVKIAGENYAETTYLKTKNHFPALLEVKI